MPPTDPRSPPAPPQSLLKRSAAPLKWLYALLTCALSVWVVSFVPAEGPPLTACIPDAASAILHVRSGSRLLEILQDHAALQELLADSDVNALFQPNARRQEALDRYERLPAPVRWLFPATADGLYPLLGREVALARLARDGEQVTENEEGGQSKSRPAVLLFSRLSGGRGALVRMAGAFARPPKDTCFFDLGGGLVALGFNGAAPVQGSGSLQFARIPAAADAPGLVHLARLIIRPDKLIAQTPPLDGPHPLAQTAQFRDLADGLPRSALEALLKPPTVTSILNFDRPPREIQLELFSSGGGGLRAWGRLTGAIPPLPAATAASSSSKQAGQTVFAEALLPVNVRAAFLRYLEQDLHISKSAAVENLSKTQKRWLYRYTQWRMDDIDLDRDLWPAFGKVLHLDVRETPEEFSASRYGQINATIAFDGARQGAREAAGDLSLLWNYCYDKPAEQKTQRVTREDFDGYVMGWKISMLGWIFSTRRFFLTSDAGLLARTSPERAVERVFQDSQRAADAPASCYFFRFDGPRMASTVEMLAERHYNGIEDDMGSKQFLERYPDAQLRIRTAKKISRLLGQLALEVKPLGAEAADISLSWTLGTLKSEEKPEEEDVAPPPPPAQ